jgi:hypothetical protein
LTPSRSALLAALLALAVLGPAVSARAQISSADTLVLQAPTDVRVRSDYQNSLKRFVVWITWRESPDNIAALIHKPDVSGWSVTTPPAQLSQPTTRGAYTGDTDRTLLFRCTRAGTVGVDSVKISYEIRREEFLSGTLYLVPSYVPGTFLRIPFRDQRTGQVRDFGIELAFSSGVTDLQGGFALGVEDFEGFHIWRGIERDGSDLEIIGELSKEEAFKGQATGGSLQDSVYFYSVIPTLRQRMPWFSPYGSVDCLGTRIDQDLDPDQLFWFDCNAVNGFTYYYAVTTFDRGYNVGSSSQGLVKRDNCTVAEGTVYACRNEMEPISMQVDAQNDLQRVYAVPNPFRSGGSRLTAENYHDFPDKVIRFVNVPPSCTIKIFTVSGDLVWETTHDATTGNVEWDVTNRNSQEVSSGVYLYRIEKPNGAAVYGRIAVIR